MLKPRVRTLDTTRVKPLGTYAQQTRMAGRSLQSLRLEVYRMDAGRCQLCGRSVELFGNYDNGCNIDHIVPLSQGGTYAAGNIWTLCHECHDAKTERERKAPDGIDAIAHAKGLERIAQLKANANPQGSDSIALGLV